MYDIIVDPGRNDCTLWIGENVSTVKGYIPEICSELHDRVMVWTKTEIGNKKIQTRSIGVDTGGYGMAYIDYLKSMGVKAHGIVPKHLDIILPRLQ